MTGFGLNNQIKQFMSRFTPCRTCIFVTSRTFSGSESSYLQYETEIREIRAELKSLQDCFSDRWCYKDRWMPVYSQFEPSFVLDGLKRFKTPVVLNGRLRDPALNEIVSLPLTGVKLVPFSPRQRPSHLISFNGAQKRTIRRYLCVELVNYGPFICYEFNIRKHTHHWESRYGILRLLSNSQSCPLDT